MKENPEDLFRQKDQHLPDLLPEDLFLLQKHIKLGKKHLENCLSKKEVDTVFQFVEVSSKTKKELSASTAEIAGHVSLVFNTILTGAVGFWLGLSAFLNVSFSSKLTLINILIVSFALGGLIGIQSIRYRRKLMREALDKLKLKDFEIQVVKKISLYREKEITEKTDELVSLLKDLKIEVNPEEFTDPQLDFQKLSLKWVSHLQCADILRDSLKRKIQLRTQYDEDTKIFKKIAQKLSHSSVSAKISMRSQIKANLSSIIIELIPTLFGGSASLFVYIGGFHKHAKETENVSWLSFLERPDMKVVQLILVVLITIYFAFSFFSMKRKDFKRVREIEEIERRVILEENRMNFLDDQLLKIKECLTMLESVHKEI